MRPRIDVEDEERCRVQAYADRHGLKLSRAWAMAVETGIEELENQEDG